MVELAHEGMDAGSCESAALLGPVFVAFAGSLTSLVGVLYFVAVTEPRFLSFVFSGVTSTAVLVVLSVVIPVLALWYGALVAWVERPCSPIRLFLDGLLLPAATSVIIALSAGRMPAAPAESAPIPEGRLDGPQTVGGSSPDDPPTGAESTPGGPLPTDGGRQ